MQVDRCPGDWALGAVQIVFLVLKAGHVVDWPWWVIFSPVWASLLADVSLALALIIVNYFFKKFS